MNNSKKVWNVIAIIAIVIAVILGINLYNKNTSYANVVQNDNNKAFYEVVDRIQNSKIYLAKSILLSPNVHYIHSLYIVLLLTKYSGQKEKTKEALLLLDKQIEEFFRLYHVG